MEFFNLYFFISKEENFLVFPICIFLESVIYKCGEKSFARRGKRINTKTEKKAEIIDGEKSRSLLENSKRIYT